MGDAMDGNNRQHLTAQQRSEFTEVFKELDADNSGFIDTTEVRQGLEQAGMTPTDEDVRQMIAKFDFNGDGELELDEWLELSATLFLGKSDHERMTEMFRAIDKENKGYITPGNLETYALANRMSFSSVAGGAAAMIEACSPAKDGQLSFDEFSALVEAVLPKKR